MQYQVITLTLYPPARVDNETRLAGCGGIKNTYATQINMAASTAARPHVLAG